jgi:rod shape-determining protein MreD
VKRILGVLAVGLVVLALQGALATFLPPALCPDLGLLYVIAIALCWEGAASGLVVAALLGYVADLVSGSMFGQHALLRLLVFGSSYLASRKINMKGALPLVSFAAAVCVAYALGAGFLTAFFWGDEMLRPRWLVDVLLHVVATAVLAPWVTSAVARLWAWLGDESAGRTSLQLDHRGRVS